LICFRIDNLYNYIGALNVSCTYKKQNILSNVRPDKNRWMSQPVLIFKRRAKSVGGLGVMGMLFAVHSETP